MQTFSKIGMQSFFPEFNILIINAGERTIWQATKLIIPSEIQNVTGLLASLKEVVSDKEAPKKK